MPRESDNRVTCQVCQRRLVPLKDGTSRYHVHRRGMDRCPGSGYRMARWPVGQRLMHHSGSIWIVEQDLGGQWGDYVVVCVDVSRAISDREAGRRMVTHGEYMHRHGWEPVR